MKVILTGATGYVGEGVLLELLRTPEVEKFCRSVAVRLRLTSTNV